MDHVPCKWKNKVYSNLREIFSTIIFLSDSHHPYQFTYLFNSHLHVKTVIELLTCTTMRNKFLGLSTMFTYPLVFSLTVSNQCTIFQNYEYILMSIKNARINICLQVLV